MPNIGDERYLLETISMHNWETLAKSRGWKGGDESLREFCDPEDAAQHYVYKTLVEAEDAANRFLATGRSVFGCCLIDRQVYDKEYKSVPPDWLTQQTFEVAMDGETIAVDR